MEVINELFGSGKDLTSLQTGCRAFVLFFITLALLHVAGMRAFGKKSPFDNIIVIMLGAVLSRAVTGASPFMPTMAAALVLVLVHRILAWVCLHNETVSRVIKGEKKSLYKAGEIHRENMQQACITVSDMMEGVRLQGNVNTLEKVEEIYMEGSGQISVVKKG